VTLPNIAITGTLRSGKDSVGEYLCTKYDYSRFAFGDEIGIYADALFPHEVADGRKPRGLYQWFGQTMRQRDPDIWVRECFDNISWFGGSRPIVITDLRQPNEHARCRAEGYAIIRVTAPTELRLQRAAAAGDNFTAADLEHETEQYVDGFEVDYEIVNDGSLAELHAKVDKVVTQLLRSNKD